MQKIIKGAINYKYDCSSKIDSQIIEKCYLSSNESGHCHIFLNSEKDNLLTFRIKSSDYPKELEITLNLNSFTATDNNGSEIIFEPFNRGLYKPNKELLLFGKFITSDLENNQNDAFNFSLIFYGNETELLIFNKIIDTNKLIISENTAENKNLQAAVDTMEQKNLLLTNELTAYNQILKNNLDSYLKTDKLEKEKFAAKYKEELEGINDGKKDVSYLWLFSFILHLFVILLIEFFKIKYQKNKSEAYNSGFRKGVKKRRYLFWFIGLIAFSFIMLFISIFFDI